MNADELLHLSWETWSFLTAKIKVCTDRSGDPWKGSPRDALSLGFELVQDTERTSKSYTIDEIFKLLPPLILFVFSMRPHLLRPAPCIHLSQSEPPHPTPPLPHEQVISCLHRSASDFHTCTDDDGELLMNKWATSSRSDPSFTHFTLATGNEVPRFPESGVETDRVSGRESFSAGAITLTAVGHAVSCPCWSSWSTGDWGIMSHRPEGCNQWDKPHTHTHTLTSHQDISPEFSQKAAICHVLLGCRKPHKHHKQRTLQVSKKAPWLLKIKTKTLLFGVCH